MVSRSWMVFPYSSFQGDKVAQSLGMNDQHVMIARDSVPPINLANGLHHVGRLYQERIRENEIGLVKIFTAN